MSTNENTQKPKPVAPRISPLINRKTTQKDKVAGVIPTNKKKGTR